MAIVFKYKEIKRPDGSTVKTPSIPITLIGTKESFDTVALIDSGADISCIPKRIAEILGLKLDGEVIEAYGLGGTAKTIETSVRIMISRGHERYTFRLPVKVVIDEYNFPVLLGRDGFFDEFKIIFDQRKEKVSLKRITDKH